MSTTPYNYIETTGIITADTSDFLTQVQTEFQTAYGADIALTNDTPQGKMITAETTARTRVSQMMAALANMINPNQAGGVFLDAICAWLGIEREAATFTVVPNVTITGAPNALFLAGQLQAVGATSKAFFVNTRSVQLPTSGTMEVDFQCQTAGPVECPINDLSIATEVLGWETISNAFAGTVGRDQESDEALRARRNDTLAEQGMSTPEAIVSALNDVPGVASLSFRENYTDVDTTIDGIFLKKHSVWACVDGGADIDIATALIANKSAGANWNGATDIPIVDPSSGQTYHVLFDRPTPVPVMTRVTLRQGTSTAELASAVPQAVFDYSKGKIDGYPGFVTGGQVSPFDISGAVGRALPGVFVAKVEVALFSVSPVWQTTELAVALNQKATITLSSVQAVIIP
jgi:uncharacterized phage protein gp47/JayE